MVGWPRLFGKTSKAKPLSRGRLAWMIGDGIRQQPGFDDGMQDGKRHSGSRRGVMIGTSDRDIAGPSRRIPEKGRVDGRAICYNGMWRPAAGADAARPAAPGRTGGPHEDPRGMAAPQMAPQPLPKGPSDRAEPALRVAAPIGVRRAGPGSGRRSSAWSRRSRALAAWGFLAILREPPRSRCRLGGGAGRPQGESVRSRRGGRRPAGPPARAERRGSDAARPARGGPRPAR